MTQDINDQLAEHAVALQAETAVRIALQHPELTDEQAFQIAQLGLDKIHPEILMSLALEHGSDAELDVLLAEHLGHPANRTALAERICELVADALERAEAA